MTKENKSLKIKTSSRRKFFKTAAKAGAVAAATVAMPDIARADGHVTLKMQAAWPSGANIFFEMAGDYCNMVKEMSGGTLTIALQPVGAVVNTSEIEHALEIGQIKVHSRIVSRFATVDEKGNTKYEKHISTAGRFLLANLIPKDINNRFALVDRL